MKKTQIAIFAACLGLIWSCTKDTTSACGTTTYKYSTEISVILNNKCNTSGCHDASAAGGHDLRTYTLVKQYSSHVLEEINAGRMPKSGSPALTTDEKAKIISWIGACSPNN